MGCARKITLYHYGPQHCTKFKVNWFSDFLKIRPPISRIFLFGNMFPENYGFVTILIKSWNIKHVKIYPYLICEGRYNCLSLWQTQKRNRDSLETCSKYKQWKLMVEFFRLSKSRGDKIARVNSIHITKSINLL